MSTRQEISIELLSSKKSSSNNDIEIPTINILEIYEIVENMEINKPINPTKYYIKRLNNYKKLIEEYERI